MAILPPSPLRVFPTKQHRALGTPARRLALVSPGTRPPANNRAAVTGDRGFFGKKSYTAACASPACLTSTIQCRSNTPVVAPSALVAAPSNPSRGTAATKTSAPVVPDDVDVDASSIDRVTAVARRRRDASPSSASSRRPSSSVRDRRRLARLARLARATTARASIDDATALGGIPRARRASTTRVVPIVADILSSIFAGNDRPTDRPTDRWMMHTQRCSNANCVEYP